MSILKVNQIQTANGVIMANLNSSGANIGFQLASTLAPAFSAYNGSTQSVASATEVKALFPTERFDTNNNFASSTFTPTVAGYYQLSSGIYSGNNSGFFNVSIFKNGGIFTELSRGNGTALLVGGSCLVYANGTSDYFDIYVYTSGSTLSMGAGSAYMWFTGSFVRSA